MPLLSQDDVIKEYWDEVQSKYPNIDFSEFHKICRSPFLHFKEAIAKGDFPMILVKHLGKFKIYPRILKDTIRSLENFKRTNTIEEEDYDRRMTLCTRLLARFKLEVGHGRKKENYIDETDMDDPNREGEPN